MDAPFELFAETIELADRQVIVRFPTVRGHSYQIEWTENLATPNWKQLGLPLPGVDAPLAQADTLTAANRFYRVVTE